ncbi:hypothetical protein DOS77_11770 [Staphylococcus felis]|uniref:Sigma-70 family RNA polymerase sigma factor n=1 Tax=Staphylococcus felis TaxID=46127 RepID=A0ABS0QKY1_9STAP|nr:hypothetical protein [Staphylococcus felis]MBH9579769.1 hypothetical protein [Staphylococcus felis]REH97124.1 hypothetical protein DOS67_03830 [Staphylococcus felis]REI19591.1 hypothetical protein DOS77_11770 [Staphylococcus felis]
MYTPNDIREMFKDYKWMTNELEGAMLIKLDSTSTSQYGVEAAQPKPQGFTSDKVCDMILRKEQQDKKLIKWARKVKFIDECEELFNKDLDVFIYRKLKQNYSHTMIGAISGKDKTTISNRVTKIVETMSNASKSSNSSNSSK